MEQRKYENLSTRVNRPYNNKSVDDPLTVGAKWRHREPSIEVCIIV